MRIRFLQFGSVLAVASALSLSGLAQDKPAASEVKSDKAPATPGTEEMMKKMAELAAPGPAHKALDSLAGEWNVEARFWMGGPDPIVSKGSAAKHWILGGRFLQEDYKGEFMSKSFQGMGLTGYDNLKQKYVGFWIDSMGTAMSTNEGTADAEGKVLTLNGTTDDPMTGEKNKPVRYILRLVSPDKHIMEMHYVALGEKSKVGEITYTRK
jgi:uncharacterized protein DUF1579